MARIPTQQRIAFDRAVWAAVSRNPRLGIRALARQVNTPHFSRVGYALRRLERLGYIERKERAVLIVHVGYERLAL